MHYAFDAWLGREYPGAWFEHYADDAVVHCVTERQALPGQALVRGRAGQQPVVTVELQSPATDPFPRVARCSQSSKASAIARRMNLWPSNVGRPAFWHRMAV
jgi:hypothetical protein